MPNINNNRTANQQYSIPAIELVKRRLVISTAGESARKAGFKKTYDKYWNYEGDAEQIT